MHIFVNVSWLLRAGSFSRQYLRQPIPHCSLFLPAAGYYNDSSLNNAGSNGNYWSRSLNTSNSNNAYNVNFNSGNVNRNNNNRYYGQSVRPVRQHLPMIRLSAVYYDKRQQ